MIIQTFKTFKKVALVLGLLSAMSLSCVTGQVPPAQIAGHAALDAKPVSLPHLYWHFLIYQHHLDQLAVEHEKQGKDGAWLRSYLQTKLSMTAEEFQPIRASADRLDSAITALNAKAKADVSALNASRTTEGVSSWNAQHYRHKLKKLTTQREAVINKEIDTLNSDLSPEVAQKLQNYIQNTFSKNVSIMRLTPGQATGLPSFPSARTGKVQP
jgi:hypothetical protein